MPGPPPKPAAQRRRRNSPASVQLPAEGRQGKVPALPGGSKMTAATRSWWQEIWRSPMAVLWVASDVPVLVRLAKIVDQIERGEMSAALLGEARQLEDRVGLTPLARRRLSWEISQSTPTPASGSANSSSRKASGGYGTLRVVLDDSAAG